MPNTVTTTDKRRRAAHRHGLYSPASPRGLTYPDKQAGVFRRALEDAVLARHGSIDVARASMIHTASEAAKLCFKNRAELRQAQAKGILTLELSLSFDSHYARFLDLRDRKLVALGLDRAPDPFDGLYATPIYGRALAPQLPAATSGPHNGRGQRGGSDAAGMADNAADASHSNGGTTL